MSDKPIQPEREREMPKCHIGPHYKNEVVFADGIIAVVGRSVVPADCKRAAEIVDALTALEEVRRDVETLTAELSKPEHYWRRRYKEIAVVDVAQKNRVGELEGALRHEWWLHHGCKRVAPYGDDGEMQCCGMDFKRHDFARLELWVNACRLYGAQAVLSKEATR